MSVTTVEQKALRLLRAFEDAGKTVSCVTVEGRKIEIKLTQTQSVDDFDGINMRHDKA